MIIPGPDKKRVIAVSGAKGGAGKSCAAVNLAVALMRLGKRVLLVEGSLGAGDIRTMLGVRRRYGLNDLLSGAASSDDLIIRHASGIRVLPSGSDGDEGAPLDTMRKALIISVLEKVGAEFDHIIIDCPGGIAEETVFFNSLADMTVIVTEAEPTSVKCSYLFMKAMKARLGISRFGLLVNKASSEKDALDTFCNLTILGAEYLNASVSYLGSVRKDRKVAASVMAQRPLMEASPEAGPSLDFMKVAIELAAPEGGPFAPIEGHLADGQAFQPQNHDHCCL